MIKWVSLFANVWIAEAYLKEIWIDIVVSNELLADRCKFYHHLYPESDMVQWDILDKDVYNTVLKKSLNEKVDFLIATPPCQGMSIAWKMEEDDPRNSLIIKAVDMILDTDVTSFLIENVPQALKTFIIYHWEKVSIPDFIKMRLEGKYKITFNVANAADYWTPQTRKRFIILWHKTKERNLPEKQKEITVRDAIWHLPSLESWEYSNIPYHYGPKHNDRHILRMSHTPTGKTALDNKEYYPQKDWRRIKWYSTTYKRIYRDKPAPTITMANGSVSSQNNVHPWYELPDGKYSDARVLSLKEIFILTWLPNDRTPPTRASENLVRKVIGEWIPPMLTKNIIMNMPGLKK